MFLKNYSTGILGVLLICCITRSTGDLYLLDLVQVVSCSCIYIRISIIIKSKSNKNNNNFIITTSYYTGFRTQRSEPHCSESQLLRGFWSSSNFIFGEYLVSTQMHLFIRIFIKNNYIFCFFYKNIIIIFPLEQKTRTLAFWAEFKITLSRIFGRQWVCFPLWYLLGSHVN